MRGSIAWLIEPGVSEHIFDEVVMKRRACLAIEPVDTPSQTISLYFILLN